MPHRTALVVGASLLALAHAPAGASTLQWRGLGSGHAAPDGETFDLPDNWIPFSVPGGADRVRFDLASASPLPIHALSQRTVQAIEVAGASVTLLNVPRISAAEYEIGGGATPSSLKIVGGSLPTATWRIGRLGAGTLDLESGIEVTAFDTEIGTGAAGTINITGPGTSWTQTGEPMTVGQGAFPGRITVSAGGLLRTSGMLGDDAGILIDGPGSRWENTGVVVFDHGPQILGGATAELDRLLVQTSSPGRSTSVSGSGSELVLHGNLELGRPGASVSGGGRLVTESATFVDHQGYIDVSNASSRWEAHGPVVVNGTSMLALSAGGEFTSTGGVYVGLESAGYAVLFEGTTWTHSGIQVGFGASGSGMVDVRQGSLLEGPPIGIDRGTVRVAGTGARWLAHGSQIVRAGGSGGTVQNQSVVQLTTGAEAHIDGTLQLGYRGRISVESGALLVADQLDIVCLGPDYPFFASGGTIRTNRLITLYSCSPPDFGTLEFGHAAGASGATHTQQPPQALFAQRLVVGRDAPASYLHTGTILSAHQFVLGEQASGVGTHDNSSELHTDNLRVGEAGAGLFRHHAAVTTVDEELSIGVDPGSSGELRMLGGTLHVQGSAFVGGSRSGPGGSGLLAQTGGTIAIDDTLHLFPGDTLQVTGGSFVASVIDLMGGVATWKGTLQGKVINRGLARCEPVPSAFVTATVTGDYHQTNEGTLRLRAASHSGHDELRVNGSATLAGTLALEMDPTFVATHGARVRLITAGAVSGSFTSITGLVPPGSHLWTIEVAADHVDLVALPNGFPIVPAASGFGLAVMALAGTVIGVRVLRRRTGS